MIRLRPQGFVLFGDGMLFDLEKLSQQVARKGVTAKYYQSTLCSCTLETGHPQPRSKCDCYNGFRYQTPVECKLLRTGVNFKVLPIEIASMLEGGCTLTIPRENYDPSKETYEHNDVYDLVSRGDVFVVKGRNRRDRDILTKGSRDKLMAFDVQKVLRVMTKGTSFVEGRDFSVDKGNPETPEIPPEIKWLTGGNAPTEGENYTVEFESLFQYIVFTDLGMDRGSDVEVLPKRVLCALRQYLRFEVNPIDTLTIQ